MALVLSVGLVSGANPVRPANARAIDFDRDVRPILAENCFACHGPDEKARKARLRLDVKEGAFTQREGRAVIVAGRSDVSELIRRVTNTDPEEVMPPPKSGRSLTPAQIGQLRRWIDEGAAWQGHWAFQTPVRPALPAIRRSAWVRNPIDAFVLARLEQEKLSPQPEADARTLARRLNLDLVGLPPAPEELSRFLARRDPEAYDRQVDRLLASNHFGERLAQMWLDLARFADSDGYHDDTTRSMWQYRDYVINSFNANKPFDQFTVEQLAGDLLPNATQEQKIASAFHRNGPTSSEGGADAKEYAARYAVDRVNTTATTWLGVTLQCAECHDHKYDPFTTREFYQMFACFNQVPENTLERSLHVAPVMATPTPEQQARLNALIHAAESVDDKLKTALETPDPKLDAAQMAWEKTLLAVDERFDLGPWHILGPFATTNQSAAYTTPFAPELPDAPDVLQARILPDWKDAGTNLAPAGLGAVYLSRILRATAPLELSLSLGSDDQLKVWFNRLLVASHAGQREVAANQNQVPLKVLPGEHRLLFKLANRPAGSRFYFSTNEKEADPRYPEARRIAALPPDQRGEPDRLGLRRYYRDTESADVAELKKQLAAAKKARDDFDKTIPRLRVMADGATPRPTHILLRGDYRNPGELVSPGVPAVLGKLPDDLKPDRLALARWLIQPQHPLTARVMVNRLWQMILGVGLVKTAEEFGTQGERPCHPELLDWLAVEFVESGWDVKHMLKLIVTSATYRQSSRMTPQLLARDPENRLLARGPRFRLPAELVRDNALAIAGLLDRQRPVGGPSVKPYQPGDLWREFAYGDSPDKAYVRDTGDALYRRSIYTFWKRSVLYPAYAMFDAPNREVCTARRPVTNTPLQAYVLLNDETFVEAARVLAQRVAAEGPGEFDQQLGRAFHLALARPPSAAETRAMRSLHRELSAEFRRSPDAAEKLLRVGDAPKLATADPANLAAWTGVANAILNFDETITKE